MKKSNITRKIDELGRIVIPADIRAKLKINEKDSLDIYSEGASIILKKSAEYCVFCGDCKDLINYNGTFICKKCLNNLSNLKTL